jgi:hypothetical protein
MHHYDDLVKNALASIANTFRRRAAGALISGRGGMLPTAAQAPSIDQGQFELITWMVIMPPQ